MNGSVDAFSSAIEMVDALARRQVSAVELLELHQRRIERFNPRLNAIVMTRFDLARAEAEAADARRARGGSGALLGVPMTLKESINVKGLRTTAGVPEWAAFTSDLDAPVTTRMKAAGAIVMGKTNVPPMLADWQSANPIFGRSVNPYDPTRTPGGSSGGGTAALAAGLTALEFGSDIGGSIRVPAAFCGVYGHRPSETALPRSGQFPIPPMPNAVTVMGVQGPLARSAADLELALGVAAGPDVGEDVAWRLELPAARHARLADYRVAVLPPVGWVPLDDEVAEAQETLISRLGNAGAQIKAIQPDEFGDLREHHRVYVSLLNAVTSSRLTEEQRQRRAELWRQFDDELGVARLRGLQASAADYITWNAVRERYRAAYRRFFRDWDVLIAPITITPAFPHLDMAWPPDVTNYQHTVEVNRRALPYEIQLVYPGVATLSGQPATAFPAGLTRAGLPIGLQAIGPYLEDHTPIRFASLVEHEWGGFQRPPGFE